MKFPRTWLRDEPSMAMPLARLLEMTLRSWAAMPPAVLPDEDALICRPFPPLPATVSPSNRRPMKLPTTHMSRPSSVTPAPAALTCPSERRADLRAPLRPAVGEGGDVRGARYIAVAQIPGRRGLTELADQVEDADGVGAVAVPVAHHRPPAGRPVGEGGDVGGPGAVLVAQVPDASAGVEDADGDGLSPGAGRAACGSGLRLKRVEMDLAQVVRCHEGILIDWGRGDGQKLTPLQFFNPKVNLA
jgi:hypothetical protein